MQKTSCTLCGEDKNFEVLYRENFDFNVIDERIFSARRTPDRYHYRIVKCKKCGLVFSNPIFEEEKIKSLYVKSKFTYEMEIGNLRETYGNCLSRIESFLIHKERLLEIGCSNGFFLEEAKNRGFEDVYGVEPSLEALTKSSLEIKKKIINDIFKPGLFKKNYFDVICFFQTLDHIINPNEFLNVCYQILKKGGFILCITHNTDSIWVKILREKSPIFDIEHIYLFNKKTLKTLFKKNRFLVVNIFDVVNKYSLEYWLQMAPFNRSLKEFLKKVAYFTGIYKKTLKLKVGNIGIIARKY